MNSNEAGAFREYLYTESEYNKHKYMLPIKSYGTIAKIHSYILGAVLLLCVGHVMSGWSRP